MGRYSKAFSIKKQFQSPNCQTCQGQSRTLKKIVFLELFLRIIEDKKWNLFEKLGQLRTPSVGVVGVVAEAARRAGVEPGGGGDGGGGRVHWIHTLYPLLLCTHLHCTHHHRQYVLNTRYIPLQYTFTDARRNLPTEAVEFLLERDASGYNS